MAWAYSTSSEVSSPQDTIGPPEDGSQGGREPAGVTIESDGGAGRWKALSKVARSARIVGDPKQSTMTIVSPLPVSPAE